MLNRILDKLFPRVCLCCKSISADRICNNCRPVKKEPAEFQTGCYYLYPYQGNLKEILHEYKFKAQKKIVSQYLKDQLKTDFFINYDLVIPVPSHWLRFFQRGFNHLHYLYNFLPNICYGLVRRKKYTCYFYKLKRQEREVIIKGAFQVLRPDLIKGKKVLIVDDIYTTGTTFNELKQELLKYNPLSVDGFFICRA
ncbi:MAG: phosphoribosyltransferase family protein [Candidatus Margulisbacteria bacterium]|nr:phosphoribosyltransferase family protein [Candidatus Margulisiibacteriota bacterium]